MKEKRMLVNNVPCRLEFTYAISFSGTAHNGFVWLTDTDLFACGWMPTAIWDSLPDWCESDEKARRTALTPAERQHVGEESQKSS